MVDLLLKMSSSNLLCVIFGASKVKEYLKIPYGLSTNSEQRTVKYTDTAKHEELRSLSVFSAY